MDTLKSSLIWVVAIVLVSKPVYATFGEDAAMIISGLSPVLERVVSGTKDIKDAMKFNEMLAQYDDIKKIQQKSYEETSSINKESKKQNQTSNQILGEVQRFVKRPDDAYQLFTNQRYRDQYLLSHVFNKADGTQPQEIKTIISKIYDGQNVTLSDMDRLYSLVSLDDEQKLIYNLKNEGLDDAAIARFVKEQREMKKAREKIKTQTEENAKMTLLIDEMKKRKTDLEAQVSSETDPKNRALIVQELDNVNSKLADFQAKSTVLDTDLTTNVSSLQNRQQKMFQAAEDLKMVKNRKQLRGALITNINRYYGTQNGTSVSKLDLFLNYVYSKFLGRGH